MKTSAQFLFATLAGVAALSGYGAGNAGAQSALSPALVAKAEAFKQADGRYRASACKGDESERKKSKSAHDDLKNDLQKQIVDDVVASSSVQKLLDAANNAGDAADKIAATSGATEQDKTVAMARYQQAKKDLHDAAVLQKVSIETQLDKQFAVTLAADISCPCEDDETEPNQRIKACTATINSGSKKPQNLAAVFNNRGKAYLARGNNDDAIADFNRAIMLDPNEIHAFNNRGIAYGRKGDYDRAIADYDQAIRLQPDEPIVFNNRANAYDRKGDYDHAIADYDQAIRLEPDYIVALLNRATAFVKLGRFDRAISDFDSLLRLDPQSALALYGRGLTKIKQGNAAGGNDDMAAATTIQDDIAAIAARKGLR